ncbi:replication-associated recombination protein A [Umboniibacter marinipuniceus]|uniref:Replication-associated recombination protein A n=1 Tax=Umboniibacter marinipuniceus TaxID=569599 RepID=A0A3M0A7Y7_9GAMM|nr:replication-associated recombination protein A [Umboniibacter marinipuniceus]RMA81271.1 recombination protein MgsA [Umboniibacter marinipuniceus]
MAEDLFGEQIPLDQPLAAKLRPKTLADYIGQSHLLGADKALRKLLDRRRLHSMIFWGPPGVGKTSLARLLSQQIDAEFLALSAVLSGTKEIREVVARMEQYRAHGRRVVLFVDEVHRFNKAQQDAFLPFVEDGDLIFIGATTENPSFEVNNALISRVKVYRLRSHTADDLKLLLSRAYQLLALPQDFMTSAQQDALIAAADGDARRCLSFLEMLIDVADGLSVADGDLRDVISSSAVRFDKGGDYFYDQISALHKSIRGSSPDGAIYWLARMLSAGCEPLYVARRLVRMASEDIGNADPRALELCLAAWEAQHRLGSPEGELALAQAAVYLASAPKSNAVYTAWKQAKQLAEAASYEVPNHLRNAPTSLMKEAGFGDDYRYAHDEPEAYAAGESYLPIELHGTSLYQPVGRGLEAKIRDKLAHLSALDQASHQQRYEDD